MPFITSSSKYCNVSDCCNVSMKGKFLLSCCLLWLHFISQLHIYIQNKEFCNSTKKRQHYFDILKAFFVRHSSEYKTLDSDRKVNRNIYPDAVTRDRMRLIDPKSGQLEPIYHCC